jgi:predicted permease
VPIGRSSVSEATWDAFSWPNVAWLREEARAFEAVEGWSLHQFALGEGEEAEYVLGHFVTGGWFDLLGSTPHLGRLIRVSDDVEIGGHPVVVLGHGLWVDRFGADSSIVGRLVSMDGSRYEVIGVAPLGYVGVNTTGLKPELFVPAIMNPGYGGSLPFDSWRWSWVNLVGRLAPGIDFERALGSSAALTAGLRGAHPDNAEIEVVLADGVGLDPVTRERTTDIARMLVLLVAVVLLLTCTNVANLFLARAADREAELGIRVALGAGRARVLRHLFAESIVLAMIATLVAVPAVLLGAELLPSLLPLDLIGSLAPDRRVWGFLIAVGLATGVVFGAAPAWMVSRRRAISVLRDGAATRRAERTRLQDGLVVVQLGLSLGLVTGAALLARSLDEARSADPGFESRGLTAGFMGLSGLVETEGEAIVRLDAALRRLNESPGVKSASVASQLPIAGGQSMGSAAPVGRESEKVQVELNAVGPRYFETLGIPLLEGRPIGALDGEPERVAVINESLARLFWPDGGALGDHLAGTPSWRIVGVVPDVRMRSLRDPGNPAIYVPLAQDLQGRAAFVVSATPAAGPKIDMLREIVQSEFPGARLSVVDVRSAVLDTVGDTRIMGFLVAGFALLALTLAVVGLYGLVSYGASRRAREFGIRIALGARPGTLSRLVFERVGLLTALGIVLGLALSVSAGRVLGGLLFGVGTFDVRAFLAALALLLTAAFAAAWLPARRAGRVDPVVSLRDGSH